MAAVYPFGRPGTEFLSRSRGCGRLPRSATSPLARATAPGRTRRSRAVSLRAKGGIVQVLGLRSPRERKQGDRKARTVLVTFEGLDCVGKSSLMREAAAGLRSAVTAHVVQLAD